MSMIRWQIYVSTILRINDVDKSDDMAVTDFTEKLKWKSEVEAPHYITGSAVS